MQTNSHTQHRTQLQKNFTATIKYQKPDVYWIHCRTRWTLREYNSLRKQNLGVLSPKTWQHLTPTI